ncbi:MAG: alkaline phosphatase, partial [Bacteroidales bacterium]
KRAMIESANEVYLVADSSKVGKSAFASLGALSLIDYLITDAYIREEDIVMLKNNDIKIIVAG